MERRPRIRWLRDDPGVERFGWRSRISTRDCWSRPVPVGAESRHPAIQLITDVSRDYDFEFVDTGEERLATTTTCGWSSFGARAWSSPIWVFTEGRVDSE